jgi:sugar lactone lactonase YvrE
VGGAAGDAGASAGGGASNEGGAAGAAGAAGEVDPCKRLIKRAVFTQKVPGINPQEDITFDGEGNLYWNSDDTIYRSQANGHTEPFVTDIRFYAGMRMTPQGDLYVANNGSSTLERISPDGTREVVMTDVDLNGVEVDRDGRVYVTEFGGQRVIRYDPATDKSVVLNAQVSTPNGVTLDPSFKTLYFSSWNGSPTKTVYRVPLQPDGRGGLLENWANGLGTGTHDGMAADACGNLYVANSGGAGQVVRVNPKNPYDRTVVVERRGETLHNFVWGRGKGWSEDRLFVVSLGVGLFSADVGVRGKSYE